MAKKQQNKQPKAKKERMDKRKVFSAVMALLLAAALLLPLLSSLVGAAMAGESNLRNQISSLKGAAAEASDKVKELSAQVKALESDKAKALERKLLMDQELNAIDAQIANTQSQIDTYAALITQEEEHLVEAQAQEEAAYEKFCRRARAMEEAGDISYLSVLFKADSYTDLLDRLAMVDEIVAYDNSVVEALADAREEVEATLASLNEAKDGLDEQKAALDVQRSAQAAKVQEAQALFDELKTQADAASALEAAARAEEKKIAAQIDKKQKELDALIASQQIKFTTGTGYAYPLSSSYRTITSKFGSRICPFHGRENHTGLDLAAPNGTNIYAVQGGVVQTSAYAPSSYGNYVVVNHGNGTTTLYAHMSSRAVKEGDIVSQGQTIGYVGSTGSSTGNHLHIELRVNGVRKDPLTMFPGVQFVDKS